MRSADQANREYFREAYRTGNHGWAVEEPSPYAVGFLERVRATVPGGTLLDLGCGEGRHARAAGLLGYRVTAVDYERGALERACDREGAVVLCQADVLELPFYDGCFDVVLDYGCLHHQRKRDWPAYRAGLLRVLKPRGFYVLSVFSPRFRFFRGHTRPWHIALGAYRRCFTADELTDLFGQQFEMVQLLEETGDSGGFWHALMRRYA